MKKPNNPFLLTGFLGSKYFCDRKEELSTLRDHILNDRNTVIYSWRRMGKTSLIQCYIHELERKKSAECIYVDLLATRSMESAIGQITQAVFDRFGKTSSGISASIMKLISKTGMEISFDAVTGVPVFSLKYKEQPRPLHSLKAVGEFLTSRKKRILLVLDEFQQVTYYSDANGEAEFRSWMQAFPGIRFIYSGSHRHMMESMFTEKNRPFYRSCQLLQLKPIKFDLYRKFITKHFLDAGKTIAEEELILIYDWCRAQTYSIQLVCNKLFGKYEKIKTDQAKQVFDEILTQESPVFSNYTKLLTEIQWNVLKAVAKEEPLSSYLSQDFLLKHRLGAASTVNTAVKMLMKKEIIIEEDRKYYVHDVILARWLQKI